MKITPAGWLWIYFLSWIITSIAGALFV